MSIESQPCPDSHPYAINNRLSCCKYYRRRNLNGHPEMDGRLMTAEDPEEFCEDFILAPKVRPGAKMRDDFEITHFEDGDIFSSVFFSRKLNTSVIPQALL